jgi:hypothetical protein
MPRLSGDASWLALPYLNALVLAGIRIVHVVRNPARVIDSMVGIRFWSDKIHEPYRTIALRYLETLGHLPTRDDLVDSVEWWWRVTETLARYAKPLRLEELTADALAGEVGARPTNAAKADRMTARDINGRPRANLAPDDFRAAPGWGQLVITAENCGYQLGE